MSEEVLRRAAAKMRERAEVIDDAERFGWYSTRNEGFVDEVGDVDAEFIASWRPTVAVTVANLLEDIATGLDLGLQNVAIEPFALAVARAYLGEQP